MAGQLGRIGEVGDPNLVHDVGEASNDGGRHEIQRAGDGIPNINAKAAAMVKGSVDHGTVGMDGSLGNPMELGFNKAGGVHQWDEL